MGETSDQIPYDPEQRTRADGTVELAWAERSWADPAWLWHALRARVVANGQAAPSSTPDGACDLYHDAVARHVGAGLTALRCYERTGWRALSYDDLHALTARRAAAWSAQGVAPGAVVAIALPMGAELAVALLACWRLGACACWIPPLGSRYLSRRLALLGPDHVASAPRYDALLADVADLVLAPTAAGNPAAIRSHAYAPTDPCALVFSPLRALADGPIALPARRAVFAALRDGLTGFALRPGDAIAAPGMDTPQHQPCLLLASLVAGACFVHIEQRDAVRDPELVFAEPLRAAGVSRALCDAVLSRGTRGAPPWEHWFKNPEEPTDWAAWRDLIEGRELGDIAMSNVVPDAAMGGAVLSSPRRASRLQLRFFMNTLPAPGQPWLLLDTNQSGQPAITDAGLLSQTEDDAPVGPDHIVLARRRGGEYLYGNTLAPRRAGCVYPSAEVLDAIADASFLRGASVVPVLSGGVAPHYRYALVGFTGAEPLATCDERRETRTRALERMIRARVGAHALPDAYELYPLHPRRGDDGIDHAWCAVQFTTGQLYRKARQPAFAHLTTVREPYIPATAEAP